MVLAVWSVLLFGVLGKGRTFTIEVVLRKQHYLQACAQGLLPEQYRRRAIRDLLRA